MQRYFLVGLTAVIAGCSPVGGSTGTTTRDFATSSFDTVRVGGADTVRIVRGPTASVVATGPSAELDRLDITTGGTVLNIGRKPTTGMNWSSSKVVVTVTTPVLRAVEASGAGDIAIDRADGPVFEASVSGSADMQIAEIRAAATKLRVSGSGNLAARGATTTLAAEVSGSGSIDAKALTSDTASIAVRGSGSVDAVARRSASINVGGSGNAAVAGTRQCAISKSGSGRARCTG